MKKLLIAMASVLLLAGCTGSFIDGFKKVDSDKAGAVRNEYVFNGYTNHWQNVYQNLYRYANLYKLNMPDIDKALIQHKRDVACDLGLPGLQLQEGFFNGLASAPYTVLENPTLDQIKEAFNSSDNVLALVDCASEAGEALSAKDPLKITNIGSYQEKDPHFTTLDAFILKKGKNNLYVALGQPACLKSFKGIIDGAQKVIAEYDLKRGWFGAATNIQSVTCTPGTPLDVMGRGMNEGNSWFVFSGGYEFLSGNKLADWVKEAGVPVVTDLGSSPIFGCDDFEGFQVQEMNSREDWLGYKAKKNGYLFRNIAPARGETDRSLDMDYDGYFAVTGNAKQINNGTKPFVITTGNLLGGTINSMVLFNKKGDAFNKAKMWEDIMNRRAVAVAEQGTVMGSDIFRQTMQLMILDREYIEEYFGDRVNMVAEFESQTLHVKVSNLYPHAVEGTVTVKFPAHLSVAGNASSKLRLAAGETKELVYEFTPSEASMGKLSAVAVEYDWDSSSKTVIAGLDMPPAVSVHQLLYGTSDGTIFPVSIHNITADKNVPVKISVVDKDNPSKVVYTEEKSFEIAKGLYKTVNTELKLPAGSYIVKTQAMGITGETQLGIGDVKGNVTLKAVDLNDDGVDEYIMENDKVRVTLLTTGARVIEYFVKSRNDNVFFKLWPENPVDVDRPNRDWAFWPFGGFEDFFGQASMETHKVYSAEIVKDSGSYAEVKMTAEYYGNVIEKIFTLYGDTPLLGIRFALDIVNPELNILGPQPIVQIGKDHGVEDKFIIPEIDGLHTYVMHPRTMYGKILDLAEGWNAAYDTREDVSFVGAYPVHRPYYLHMWMNLSSNNDSHYPYTELQPWLPVYRHNTSYFSYYMWADGTTWEKGVKELRDRNLITQR